MLSHRRVLNAFSNGGSASNGVLTSRKLSSYSGLEKLLEVFLTKMSSDLILILSLVSSEKKSYLYFLYIPSIKEEISTVEVHFPYLRIFNVHCTDLWMIIGLYGIV